ncbi:prominin-1-like isoform X3 [Oratosquilla oratoria]|uniref:prominin-1-like isoform X3 n=1 Tax=Oratosquilla oratoria TaxID=337810 RepID=UPI003F768113
MRVSSRRRACWGRVVGVALLTLLVLSGAQAKKLVRDDAEVDQDIEEDDLDVVLGVEEDERPTEAAAAAGAGTPTNAPLSTDKPRPTKEKVEVLDNAIAPALSTAAEPLVEGTDEEVVEQTTIAQEEEVLEEVVVEEEKPSVVFSEAWVNTSYSAKDDFNPRGMEHLYFITNMFLDLIYRHQEMPERISALVAQELEGGKFDQQRAMRLVSELEANWDVLVKHYVGMMALVVLGLLMAVTMPVIGLVVACCRCAGHCGADHLHYDKKRDPCKRVALGTLLAAFVVIILLGLVCAFVTNARVEEGVQSLPSQLHTSVHDTRLYLNNTNNEVRNLLVKNYKELQRVLFTKLDSSGELVKSELARVSKAIAIENLTAIATSLTYIKKDLSIIRNTTEKLQKQTSTLQSGLHEVAMKISDLRKTCESLPECRDLIDRYGDKLEINTQFYDYLETDVLPQLPNVESKLDDVTRLIDSDIEREVRRGKRDFDSIATDIQNTVQKSIPEIKKKIRQGGGQLMETANNISHILEQIDVRETGQYLNLVHDAINEYAMYRYWGFLGICILLLVITLCFSLGVVFGCCGRRPDEATSCHKATGASWLMWGVGLTFLFSVVVMTATTALFVVGSASDILVCDPLRDPDDSEVFKVIADHFKLDFMYPGGEAPSVISIIIKCHANESLYSVLNLEQTSNDIAELKNYRERFKLDEQVAALKRQIEVDTNVVILTREAKQQLWELANSSVADKDTWDYYTDILEQKVLSIDLMELAALLNQTADQLPAGYDNTSIKLKNDALFCEGQHRWVESIGALTRKLKSTTESLNQHLKFNKTSLREAIKDLIGQAEYAQNYLRTNGSKEVIELVDRFSKDFLGDIDDYAVHVELMVENEVGRCGPMSTVYNATASSVCKDILYPFNGFWASVGWCFMLFIPCIVLAIYLASLYRKTEPYPGPLNESAYDKKGRRRSRDAEGAAVQGQSSSYYNPQAQYPLSRSSPPRQGYTNSSDWDYPPTGGPPRYTSQPSLSPEYERPPPYYYPGPGPQYYPSPPPGLGSVGGYQAHPPPPSVANPPPAANSGPQGPTNYLNGPTPWNSSSQRTINLGGWKISPAYSRDEYDA